MELKRSRLLFSFFLTLMVAAFIALPGMALADGDAVNPDENATVQNTAAETQDGDAASNGKADSDAGNEPAASNQSEPAGGNSGGDTTQPSGTTEPAPAADKNVTGEGAAPSGNEGEGNVSDDVSSQDDTAVSDDQAAQAENTDTTAQVDAADQANVTEQVAPAAAATTTAVTAKATTVKKTAAKTVAKKATGQLIADGWYYIASKKLISLVLSTAKAGKNAVVKTDKAQMKQQWYVKYDAAKKAYTLLNRSSSKYLSIKSTKKGANVRLVKSGKNAKSFWVIKEAKGGYTLKAYSCKYLLDINGGKEIKNGANVDIDKRKKSGTTVKSYQRWVFIPRDVDYDDSSNYVNLGDGFYTITLRNATSTAATVPNSNKNAGVQLTTSTYESGLNQKYALHKKSDGTYTLQSVASGKFVAIDGSEVVQNAASGDDTQKWRVVDLGSGVALVNVATNKTLRMSGGKAVAGSRVNSPTVRLKLSKKNILDNGNFYIHIASGATNSNVMTVNGDSKSDNAKLSVKAKSYYKDSGTFEVTHLGNGVYQFKNVNSGKLLVASGSSAVQSSSTGNNSKWMVTMDPEGGVILKNVGTKKVLASATAAGSAVTTQAASGADTQTWHVEKAQVLKGYQKKALKHILKRNSKKNYYLFADLGKARMMIWERANKNSEWHLKYDYIIAYGRLEGGKSRTPTGDYAVQSRTRWLDSAGDWNGYWSAPWAVRWSWAWFHARTHAYKHSSHVVDKRLGLPISNGCIRQPDFYAKWIYDNYKKLKRASVTVWKNGRF